MKSSKSFFAFAVLLLALQQSVIHAFAQPTTPKKETWITNATVSAVAYSKGLIYIGGDFTYVGPNTGCGAALSTTTGAPDLNFPKVNGAIDVVTPDGADGWYIGGKFTKVGDFTRNWIAHIKADGTVDPNWDPNPAGTPKTDGIPYYASMHIYAIVVSGSTVYVGGNFTSIGGQPRNCIAALEASTGQATSWNPNASSIVRAIAIKDTTMYVGGAFSSIGGQSIQYLAAIDLATGNAATWNMALNSGVTAIAIKDSLLLVGGFFTSAGGQARNHFAAIDLTIGQVTILKPSVDLNIYTLVMDGTTLYLGGNFKSVGGGYIAALSINSNTTLSWNPGANGAVHTICVNGSTIYVGGDFTSIGGKPRQRIAALDKATGNATAWSTLGTGLIRGLATNTDGSVLYAGGTFGSIGGQGRSRLAALNAATGAVTAWNPNASNSVQVITINGPNVYIGGLFTAVGGASRSHIAAIDATTGSATAWNPNANDNVYAITIDGSTVYAGGKFTMIGGQTRYLLAALDIDTGLAKSWNPNVGVGGVYNIFTKGDTIYIGGDFYSAGGQLRQAVAAIDANTGQATAWNPNLNASSIVYAMALDGSTLYIGGTFNTVKGQTRNRLAAVDLTTAEPTAWNPDANAPVRVLTQNGANVYATGTFTSLGAQTRNYLAAIDKATGVPTDWNPNPNGFGYSQSLLAVGSAILAGGTFTTMGGNLQSCFAQFGDIVVTNNPPNAPSAINQYKTDATTAISEGGTSNEKKIVFKATVSDPDDDQVKLQIELRKTNEAFTGTPTRESLLVNSGMQASIESDTLVAADYKWRYRVMDALGLATAWVEFGTPGNTDFVIVLNGAPTLAAVNQFKSDATTAIAEGGKTNEKKVVFKATVSDPNNDQVKLQIELRKYNEAYTGLPNLQSGLINSGAPAVVIRDSLVDANYKWRYRAMDANGLAGAWVDFGAPANIDFIVATNKPPAAPTTLKQLKANGTTAIAEGGTTNENKVIFKGTVSDPDGEQVKLQIELRKMAEAFTGTPNLQSSLVNSGASATVAAENLGSANYKWRFRAMDARGKFSTWTEFGTPSNIDFTVNAVPIYPVADSSQRVGEEFWVEVYVGTNAMPVTKLFGLSFVLGFTQGAYIDVVTPYTSSITPGPFMGPSVLLHQMVDETVSKVTVGISRTNGQSNVNGYGAVLRVKFVSSPNTPAGTQVKFTISNVAAIDSLGNPVTLVTSPMTITLNSSATKIVWPGDTNNDGAVDQADILPLGVYWTATGVVRPSASMQWIGQPCPSWTAPLATYADATGDGKIDQTDIFPIGLNWGKSSTAAPLAANSGLEKVSTSASATIAPEIISAVQPPNQEFLMRIKVTEVSDLFGLSFELNYDQPQLLQVLMVEPDSSFGQDVVFYSNTDAANGKIAVGISRKVPQSGMSGAGSVVRVKAKLAANVTAGTKITLSLQNVKANDANGTAMSLSPQTVSLTVSSTTGIDSNAETSAPTSYRLLQNHPNPFNAGTLITYEIPQAGPVSMKIYNLAGQEILEMVNAVQQPGRYQINWNGRDSQGKIVPSGVYICRIQAGSFVQTQRMIMVR